MRQVPALGDGVRAACVAATLFVHGLIFGPAVLWPHGSLPPEPEATVQLALISEAESEEAETVEPEVAKDENADAADVPAEAVMSEQVAALSETAEAAQQDVTAEAPPVTAEPESLAEAEPQDNATATEPDAAEAVAQAVLQQTPEAETPADTIQAEVEDTASVVAEDARKALAQPMPVLNSDEKPREAAAESPEVQMPRQTLHPKTATKTPAPDKSRIAKPRPNANPADGKHKTATPGRRAVAGRDQQGGAKAGGRADTARYRSIVQSRLSARKGMLAGSGARGVVAIRFTIGPGGGVTSAAVARSSGNGALDAAARNLVASASFPPPPGGSFSAVVPFRVN